MEIDLKTIDLKDLTSISEIISRKDAIPSKVANTVKTIIEDIKSGDEKKLLGYVEKLDSYKARDLSDLKVTEKELEEAYVRVSQKMPGLAEAISVSKTNIEGFHKRQKQEIKSYWTIDSGPAIKTAQIITPIEKIGIYIPGGRYPYPSTVLMCAVPAVLAGSKKISFFSPPDRKGNIDDAILFAIRLCGLKDIYKIGGAQAVAVMAYGIGCIEKVDKIVGPGNIYVTAAKKAVFGEVGIDSLAGPSEVVILADSKAEPGLIAVDLLSQAEHDPEASAILLTTSLDIAEKTIDSLKESLCKLQKKYGARFSFKEVLSTIERRCKIIYSPDIGDLIDACNFIAPEHLELMMRDSGDVLSKIKNAGAIFIGDYSPVAIGDYFSGTNHVIPTRGNARFASPLGVYDFIKRSSISFYDRSELEAAKRHIETFSDTENLLAHKESVIERFKHGRQDES